VRHHLIQGVSFIIIYILRDRGSENDVPVSKDFNKTYHSKGVGVDGERDLLNKDY
jgi:hypothetical protein